MERRRSILRAMASTPSYRNGEYQVKWRPGRAGKWQSCTFGDEQDALRAKRIAEDHGHRITREAVYRIVLNLPDKPAEVEGLTFAEWAQQWLTRKKGIEPATMRDYERQLRKRIRPFFGSMAVRSITEDDVAAWVSKLETELAPATIAHYHALLHQILADAVPAHADRNPAAPPAGRRVKRLPKIQQHDVAIFLTQDQANQLVRVAPADIRDLVRTALGTGMRLGELVALQVRHLRLDTKNPTIRVERALKKGEIIGAPKSRRSRRTITISSTLADALRHRANERDDDELVFPAPMGGMWSESNLNNRYWKRAIAAASVCPKHPPATKLDRRNGKQLPDPYARSTCPCPGRLDVQPRLHDLRHTHAGWLLDEGWDFHKLQLRLGHESIKTTIDIYGHRRHDADTDKLDSIGI